VTGGEGDDCGKLGEFGHLVWFVSEMCELILWRDLLEPQTRILSSREIYFNTAGLWQLASAGLSTTGKRKGGVGISQIFTMHSQRSGEVVSPLSRSEGGSSREGSVQADSANPQSVLGRASLGGGEARLNRSETGSFGSSDVPAMVRNRLGLSRTQSAHPAALNVPHENNTNHNRKKATDESALLDTSREHAESVSEFFR
jgi:hypothetical protein